MQAQIKKITSSKNTPDRLPNTSQNIYFIYIEQWCDERANTQNPQKTISAYANYYAFIIFISESSDFTSEKLATET